MKELSFTPKSLSAITVAGTLTSESLQVMKKSLFSLGAFQIVAQAA
jgi:hypothetical protein